MGGGQYRYMASWKQIKTPLTFLKERLCIRSCRCVEITVRAAGAASITQHMMRNMR